MSANVAEDDLVQYETVIPRAEPPASTLEVIRMPLDRQCEFADHVCVNGCSDPVFVHQAIEDLRKNEQLELVFYQWNATSIGNCAYLAKYAAEPRQRAVFSDVLERFSAWREAQESRFWLFASLGIALLFYSLLI